jgi:hypothetical protein
MFQYCNTLFRVFLIFFIVAAENKNFVVSKSSLFLHGKTENDFKPAYTSSSFYPQGKL